jgi:hypothetical protein
MSHDQPDSLESVPPTTETHELSAMIRMIDYLLPQCRSVSPVTTVLLALARRELVTVQMSHQEVVRNIAARL